MSSPSSSSSSTVMFQDLPELSLLNLFHGLPLHYLLHIDEVCSDWGRLKAEALRQRKELIIVSHEIHLDPLKWPDNGLFWSIFDRHLVQVTNEEDGSSYIKLKTGLDRHVLPAYSITSLIFDQITTLMSKLKVLRIIQFDCTFSELEQINRLLAFYRDQLVELTLCFQWGIGDIILEENPFTPLFSTINSMTVLKSLKLFLCPPYNPLIGSRVSIAIADLSVLIRLKIVVLYCGRELFNLSNQLKKYAEENERLEKLFFPYTLTLNKFLAFGPRVSAAMRDVRLQGHFSATLNYDNFQRFTQQYANLQRLEVPFVNVSFVQLTEALATSCKKLAYLNVRTEYDEMAVSELENSQPLDGLPVLPSLKVLKLELRSVISHHIFELLNLNLLFPNVQVFDFHTRYSKMCNACADQVPSLIENEPEQKKFHHCKAHTCDRLNISSFAKFTKLTALKAYFSREKIEFYKYYSFTRDTLEAFISSDKTVTNQPIVDKSDK